MAIKHQITRMLFPTPLLEYQIEDAARLNALLRAEIAERAKSEPSNNRSNVEGWHSQSDLFQRTEPGHKELTEAIANAVRNATRRIGSPKGRLPKLRFSMSGWVNVNPPGAYNMPHDHPGAFWSGAYYVSMPPASKVHPEHGAISFIDHRPAPAGQPAVQSPVFRGNMSFRPEEGTIMLFPGTVRHWVHPQFNSETDRISIAFNAIAFGTNEAAQPAKTD